MESLFNIVLYNPVIPNNTGNIGRLSVATNCPLHLIHPLGFSLDEKAVRRSGIDWWHEVSLAEYANWEDFTQKTQGSRYFFFSRFATHSLYETTFQKNDYMIFGAETTGLPEYIKEQYPEQLIKIPMPGKGRSLNLANSVSICIYEGLRQLGYQ